MTGTEMTSDRSTKQAGDPLGQNTTSGRSVPAIIRRRLAPLDAKLDPISWLATGVVVLIAALLRVVGLSHPKGKIFDEIYYARDAWGLVTHGVEWNFKDNTHSYVVHPPLGKWLIGLGEWAFGYEDPETNISVPGRLVDVSPEFGWRIAAAVAGTLSVLIVIRVARRLFRSTVLGCTAGLLMALDGFHLVLSRTALLDIFLLLFVLAAFVALIIDRDASRARWLRIVEAGIDPNDRERVARRMPRGVPWWRLLAGVLLGCAIAVKWSGLYFLPVFVLLMLVWEAGARRSVGVERPWRQTLRDEASWVGLSTVLVPLSYLASWSGWFLTDHGYFRHWRADTGQSEPPVIGALLNLLHYHHEAFKFHSGLAETHIYQSWPWQWLLLGRPVAFYWSSEGNCGDPSCAAEILLLGTPLLWWSFLPALVALVWLGIARRDWRAYTILLFVAAGLLPWFYYAFQGRTMFSFYTAPVLPFLILAVVYVLGAIATPAPDFARSAASATTAARPAAGDAGGEAGASTDRATDQQADAREVDEKAGADSATADDVAERLKERRLIGTIIAATYVLLVAICFAYFYPIFVGKVITYAEWSARMWLGNRWI